MSSVNKYQRDYFIERFKLKREWDKFIGGYIYKHTTESSDDIIDITLHYDYLGDYYYCSKCLTSKHKFRSVPTRYGIIRVPITKTSFIYYNEKGDEENV